MSFREAIFIDEIFKSAKVTLHRIMQTKRNTFWGETPVVFRIRKLKAAGRVRREEVSVVKPNLNNYKLYSQLLGKQVTVRATPQMVRYIEASGGLDDYLLKTQDDKLFSDVASKLKVQLLQIKQGLRKGSLLPQAAEAAATPVGPAGSGDVAVKQAGKEKKLPPWARDLEPARQERLHQMQEQYQKERRKRVQDMLQAAANPEALSVDMQRRGTTERLVKKPVRVTSVRCDTRHPMDGRRHLLQRAACDDTVLMKDTDTE